jgi:hypothetical protein
MKRGMLVLVLGLGLGLPLVGCAHEAAREVLAVGVHRISLEVPPGWQEVDQGRRRLLRRGELQIAIADLGPLDRRGIRREIERARALWRRGEDREARSAMAMIPVAPQLFVTAQQRRAFWETWSALASASPDLEIADAEQRFDRLLDAVAGLKALPDFAIVDLALVAMGEDRRRARASSERRGSGLEAPFLVVTWYRISHDDRRRYAIWIDDGRPLALSTEGRDQPEIDRAFDAVERSLRIETAVPVDSAGARRSRT